MNRNPGQLGSSADLHPNKGHFGAANSVTTNAEQFIPPYAGSLTSTTVTTWGILWESSQTVIERYTVKFQGDAANAQTVTFRLHYRRGGVTTVIPGSTCAAIDTGGGQHEGGKDLVANAASFTPQPGDIILCSMTPSAGLGAALTGIMVSLG